MSKPFYQLLEDADRESLTEAHERLWAAERGRPGRALELASSEPPEINLDWRALERIALKPDPLERLERWVLRWPVWIGPVVATVAPLLAWWVFLWAYRHFPMQDLTDKLAALAVTLCAVVLTALIVGAAVWAGARTRNAPAWLAPTLATTGAISLLALTMFSGITSPIGVPSPEQERLAGEALSQEQRALLEKLGYLTTSGSSRVPDDRAQLAVRNAELLTARDKHSRARSYFDLALALDPSAADVYNNRGALLRETGAYDKAIADFKTAIQLKSERLTSLQRDLAVSYNNLALSQCRLGQLEVAAEARAKALECDPKSADAYQKLAQALREKGEEQEAEAVLACAVQLDQVAG